MPQLRLVSDDPLVLALEGEWKHDKLLCFLSDRCPRNLGFMATAVCGLGKQGNWPDHFIIKLDGAGKSQV